jgi:hypothetical protein
MRKQGEFISNKLLKIPFLKVLEWFVKTYGHNVLPHFFKKEFIRMAIPAYLWLKDDGEDSKDQFWIKRGIDFAKRTGF